MSLEMLSNALRAVHRKHGGDGVHIRRPDLVDDDEWWRKQVDSQWEFEENKWEALCEADSIPRRLTEAAFEDAAPSDALARAKAYIAEGVGSGECLLLAGPTGVGKSFAAVAALRAKRTASRGFRYFPALAGELLDPQRRQAALRYAKEQHFVVFDDIGVEYVKDGGLIEAFFDEIVWHREGNEMPTIFTTNLTAEQLKARLSDRIIDRLRGWGTVCAVGGPSLRGC